MMMHKVELELMKMKKRVAALEKERRTEVKARKKTEERIDLLVSIIQSPENNLAKNLSLTGPAPKPKKLTKREQIQAEYAGFTPFGKDVSDFFLYKMKAKNYNEMSSALDYAKQAHFSKYLTGEKKMGQLAITNLARLMKDKGYKSGSVKSIAKSLKKTMNESYSPSDGNTYTATVFPAQPAFPTFSL